MVDKFDVEKLKKISIVDYLSTHGLKPKRITGRNVAFLSPFREESVPSLFVDTYKNRWKDYGSARHGDSIDICMALNNCSFNDACEILSKGSGTIFKEYTPTKKSTEPGVKIHSVSAITDTELLNYYTKKRKIDEKLIHIYCSQLVISFPHGRSPEKMYTVIGFPNVIGGYDFRGKESWLKMGTSKSFSKVDGVVKSKECNLFEAANDYLAALTYMGVERFKHTTYILNGVSQINVLKPLLDGFKVNFFCDADAAGDGVLKALDNCTVRDMRYLFEFKKDFNDKLVSL